MSIYSTKTMLRAIEVGLKPKSFLRDTFFPNVETHPTSKLEIDFKRGKRKMAPFVSPIKGGKIMSREGFVTNTYKPPKIAPERLLTTGNLEDRMMGESVYSPKTPEERAQIRLAKDLVELDEAIVRREEWMARELLLNGKFVAKGYTDDDKLIEQEIDFDHDGILTLVGEEAWTNPNADILAFLKAKRKAIIKDTGVSPDILLMASDVTDLLNQNTKLKEVLDNKGINEGRIEPSIRDEAVTFIGKINSLGVEIYTYDEWFVDDDEEEKPMIPEGHIIYGKKGRGSVHYGAITQIEDEDFITYEAQRVPKQWADKQNDVKKIRLSSSPLPIPEDVKSWVVINVKG